MVLKDWLLPGVAILGWAWAILQFILTRRNQKKDKALEKRFEVYSNFMSKADDIGQNLRTDPNDIYSITTEMYGNLISSINNDDFNFDNALVDYQKKLIEKTKSAMQPTMIMNQELNKLKLICSDQMLPLIDEVKSLSSDLMKDLQNALNNISSKDQQANIEFAQSIGHDA